MTNVEIIKCGNIKIIISSHESFNKITSDSFESEEYHNVSKMINSTYEFVNEFKEYIGHLWI